MPAPYTHAVLCRQRRECAPAPGLQQPSSHPAAPPASHTKCCCPAWPAVPATITGDVFMPPASGVVATGFGTPPIMTKELADKASGYTRTLVHNVSAVQPSCARLCGDRAAQQAPATVASACQHTAGPCRCLCCRRPGARRNASCGASCGGLRSDSHAHPELECAVLPCVPPLGFSARFSGMCTAVYYQTSLR